MKVNRIYIQDWLAQHPYQGRSEADSYYLQVANEVYGSFQTLWFDDESLDNLLKPEQLRILSIYLTCYLEDVIAETHIFSALRDQHKELYGKFLPFYADSELIDYYPEDINFEDVKVLVWLFFSERNPHLFFDINSRLVQLVADLAYAIFEVHYEIAPVNFLQQECFQLSTSADFFETRNFAEKVVATNYLTGGAYHFGLAQQMQAAELHRYQNNPAQWNQMAYRVRDNYFNTTRLPFLAEKPCVFAAACIGKGHPLYKDTATIGDRLASFFAFQKRDERYIYFRHHVTGRTFALHEGSIPDFRDPVADTIFYMEIVPWTSAWFLSGVMSQVLEDEIDTSDPLEQAVRVRIEALDNNYGYSEAIERQIAEMRQVFDADYSNQLVFIKAGDFGSFVQDFMSRYKTRFGYPDIVVNGLGRNSLPTHIPLTVFFNPSMGIEYFTGVEAGFPLSHNIFFQEDNGEVFYAQNFIALLVENSFPKELVRHYYLLFKQDIDDKFFYPLEESTFDFLLRFYKRESYHLMPAAIPETNLV